MSDATYILCLDEGGIASINDRIAEEKGNTALMVNPDAPVHALIDGAHARITRIEKLTRVFAFLDGEDLGDLDREDLSGFLETLNGMSLEATRLLEAAAFKQYAEAPIAPSRRQVAEGDKS